jgi:uncharacterized protein (TIGR03790 family)
LLPSMTILRIAVGAVAVVLGTCTAARAQTGVNVAVIINDASPDSIEIGEYYARKRDVPASNIIHILAPIEESITRAAYGETVERPIVRALIERGIQDRVLYIVLTKGVPLKIAGRAGLRGDAASVDSELALSYRKMTGRDVGVTGTAENPYYAGTRALGEARPFNRREHDVYLVTRLDGFTVKDVLALVDRGAAASRDGRILLDRRAGPTGAPEIWLLDAATTLRELGHGNRVDVVEAPSPQGTTDALLGYFSWGSNDPANHRRRLGLRFSPGAIAATLAGTDARTFAMPPDTWEPGGDPRDRSRIFAGGTQSLIADMIRDGVTGAAGNVSEPLLASAIRPQILFPAYLSGFNLAESFYLALPHLSWQTVVVGDPLCRPFEGRALTDADIESPREPVTGLPGYFAERRMSVVRERNRNAPAEAIALIVRADIQLSAGDRDGARRTLEDVTRRAPDLGEQHLQLAGLYEDAGDFEAAMQRYRRVLELEPRHVVALNNLAYRVAVYSKAPSEALVLARRAAALAPQDPRVLDTLGWINHLLGNSAEAVRLLTEATARAPRASEIRLHAAFALAAAASYAAAENHLNEAIRLSPKLASRPDVEELRATLSKRR